MFILILNYAIIFGSIAIACFVIKDLGSNIRDVDLACSVIALTVVVCGATLFLSCFISTGEEKKEIENIKTVEWNKTSFRLTCDHYKCIFLDDFNKIKKFSEKYNFPTPENETYTRNLENGSITISVEHTSYRNMNGSRSYEESIKLVEPLEKLEK